MDQGGCGCFPGIKVLSNTGALEFKNINVHKGYPILMS